MTKSNATPIPAVVRMRDEAKILNRVMKALAVLPDDASRAECLRRATMSLIPAEPKTQSAPMEFMSPLARMDPPSVTPAHW